MARVKLTEYRAKHILLGDSYEGVSLRSGETPTLPEGSYVVKVDEGIKKRMKQGLVALKVAPKDVTKQFAPWEEKGFSQFIVEPFLPHDASEERYLSLERVRDGIRVLYAKEGGIEIEEHPEKVEKQVITDATDVLALARALGIPETFFTELVQKFEEHYFAFLEINPLVIQGDRVYLLDAAALVDSAAGFFARGSWSDTDIVQGRVNHPAEANVEALAATTPASLKLNVINPNGSLFFLLSGGGGSIVIADEAQARGYGKEIANYGEYSGGPTQEETYLYAKEVISLILSSNAKKKALVIAGGVANFTDVKETFRGIVSALGEVSEQLHANNVRVFVRRGGPNEEAGLRLMREFLEKEEILGTVSGSDAVITQAVDDAIDYLTV